VINTVLLDEILLITEGIAAFPHEINGMLSLVGWRDHAAETHSE
jgi:hypothetical protein